MITIENTIYYEVEDLSKILGINKRSIARLVKGGKIKCFKPSERRTYFNETMIKEYLEGK